MNHSKAFWKVRDDYAVDLRALWTKGYTGEGMWGRGRGLETGALQMDEADAADIPEHLCGGTYGRRSRKRKRGGKDKPMLSYAERKQRRILKKFGTNGQPLGADEETKVKLEGGVPKKGKPRVAGSARGRELRAAAALARFEPAKKEDAVKREKTPSDSETEDESTEQEAAVDVDGRKMRDDQGRFLIKICDEADDKDGNARREFDEIQGMAPRKPSITRTNLPDKRAAKSSSDSARKYVQRDRPSEPTKPKKSTQPSSANVRLDEVWKRRPAASTASTSSGSNKSTTCDICSLENDAMSLTCVACSNVLKPDFVFDHWTCHSQACKGSWYLNSGDARACGVCGTLRPRN